MRDAINTRERESYIRAKQASQLALVFSAISDLGKNTGLDIVGEPNNLSCLLDERRSFENGHVLANALFDARGVSLACVDERKGSGTYLFLISPNFISSMVCFSSGASSERAFLKSASWKWVMPQSAAC